MLLIKQVYLPAHSSYLIFYPNTGNYVPDSIVGMHLPKSDILKKVPAGEYYRNFPSFDRISASLKKDEIETFEAFDHNIGSGHIPSYKRVYLLKYNNSSEIIMFDFSYEDNDKNIGMRLQQLILLY